MTLNRIAQTVHHSQKGESAPVTFLIEDNGFSISISQAGRYLTLQCSEVPEAFRSTNFVNRYYVYESENEGSITLASRSNPSIASLDFVFLRGAYDDLNDKPYVYDMQGLYLERLRSGFPNTTYRQLAESFAKRLANAVFHFTPDAMATGKRMEGGEAQTPTPPRFRARVAPSLKDAQLQKGFTSLNFDIPGMFQLSKKGAPLFTFGTVLHQEFIEQAKAQGAEILPWGSDPLLCEAQVNLLVLDHPESVNISPERASQIISDAAFLGVSVILVSQEYGLGSIPMKEEHREHMRVMADRQQVAASVATRSMFFPVPTHYIEGVLHGSV